MAEDGLSVTIRYAKCGKKVSFDVFRMANHSAAALQNDTVSPTR